MSTHDLPVEPLVDRPCSKVGKKEAHDPHVYIAGRYLPTGDLGFDAQCPGWSDPYPQHTALAAVKDVSQAQGEVLDWCIEHGYADVYGDIPTLLALFHGIDPEALEREKRAMLAAIREGTG